MEYYSLSAPRNGSSVGIRCGEQRAAKGDHKKKGDPPCVLVCREKTKISLIRTHGAAFIAPWSVFCVGLGINLGSGSPSLNVFRVKSLSQGSILYMYEEVRVI